MKEGLEENCGRGGGGELEDEDGDVRLNLEEDGEDADDC